MYPPHNLSNRKGRPDIRGSLWISKRIDLQWVPHDLIIKTTCRMIIPFIQIFALYVIAHGHHSPWWWDFKAV